MDAFLSRRESWKMEERRSKNGWRFTAKTRGTIIELFSVFSRNFCEKFTKSFKNESRCSYRGKNQNGKVMEKGSCQLFGPLVNTSGITKGIENTITLIFPRVEMHANCWKGWKECSFNAFSSPFLLLLGFFESNLVGPLLGVFLEWVLSLKILWQSKRVNLQNFEF